PFSQRGPLPRSRGPVYGSVGASSVGSPPTPTPSTIPGGRTPASGSTRSRGPIRETPTSPRLIGACGSPPPSDHPRGENSSFGVYAVEGPDPGNPDEPPLDRIVRFHDAVALRPFCD